MPRYKIIVNPIAGRGAGEESIPRIERMLSTYNLDFDLVRTERPWHAAELAHEAAIAGYDAVIAMGGDGTSNEVLNGLMQAKTSILDPADPPPRGEGERNEKGVRDGGVVRRSGQRLRLRCRYPHRPGSGLLGAGPGASAYH
jgi:hypothetical protein